ncbi:hypothetical protein [Brevibacterium aurantiacum]|uniref:Uncharacterized protein n=1 Tax=Brevibacterium aurantiacum TaxID=273384 RepID=A0A556CJR5_BREAU|nr:hypothetical protein [Brevibacterium aurantiacum]TSI17669.1 hypothetical protein FO013_05545 [Brevibacterium aurantiacum]
MRYDGAMLQESAAPTTVRMFPDYADTVLWLVYPVDYEDTALSPGLIRELETWERSYYETLDADFNWKSPEDAQAFTKTGIDLAGLVANELGEEFIVEFASYEIAAPTYTAHSRRRADNVGAATAFSAIAEELEAEQERVTQLAAEAGPNAEWAACAPLAGDVLPLGGNAPQTEDRD